MHPGRPGPSMDCSQSSDVDAGECLICCNTYGNEFLAMSMPCCKKTLCRTCAEMLPIMQADVKRRCPFCRTLYDMDGLLPDLKSQERGLRVTAKEKAANYVFNKAPCPNCKRITRFPDYFVCFSCHPAQIDRGFHFERHEIKKVALCARCTTHHCEDDTHLAEPITIYTVDSLEQLATRCNTIIPRYKTIPLIPAFLFCLLKASFIRLHDQDLPNGYLKWFSETSTNFVHFVEDEHFQGEKLRRCAKLFVRSYWALLRTTMDRLPATLELDDILLVLGSMDDVVCIAVILTIPPEDQSVGTEAAAERIVWDDCFPILRDIQQRVQRVDGLQLSDGRMQTMYNILDIIKIRFLSVETDYVQQLVEEETQVFNEIMCDPSTSVQIQRRLTEYQEGLNLMVQQIEEQRLERVLCIAEEERRALQDYDSGGY